MTVQRVLAGDLMARRSGSVDPAKFLDEVFELHSIPAFDLGRPEIVRGGEIGSTKQIVQPDDVMISKIVPHIRRASVVGPATGLRQIASGEWIVFRSERIHPPYLRHVLISDEFNASFMRTVSGVGGSLLRARPSEVAKIEIPLPPLPEQRRIAAILDKADALRAKRRVAIAKLDQLLQAVFLDMFGDPVKNPKNWPTVALSDVTTKIGSGATPTGGDESYKKEGIALIRSMNVHDGKFRWAKIAHIDKEQAQKLRNVVVEFDDVLLNITGASVARVCRAPIAVLPARVNQHVAIIRCGSLLSPTYLEYALMSPSMKAKLLGTAESGATRQAITKAEIEKIVVALPPIDKQKEFAHVAERASGQIDKGQKSSRRIEALFATLQSQVFGT